MPNQMNGTACPRCRRPDSVRHEKVIRGAEAFIYYQCGACRYSWQVRDPEPGPTRSTRASSTGARHPHRKDR